MKSRAIVGYLFWALSALGCSSGLTSCEEKASAEPVAVELSMMSKCPFANPVLKTTLRALKPLGEHATLRVSYLGQEREGSLFSIRGDAELTGDKLGLCVQELSGEESKRRKFLDCLASRFEEVPSGWTQCAESSGIPVDGLRDCAEGKQGHDLARRSFEANAKQGITSSPTLRIAGTEYKGPRHSLAMTRAICDALGDRGKEACSKVPAPRPVQVTIISDARCRLEGCSPEALEGVVRAAIPGARIKRVDFSAPEGRRLTQGLRYLPAAVIAPSLAADREAMTLLGDSLLQRGSGHYVLPSGTNWDPRAEVCGDGDDNDGDGRVDCADDDCLHRLPCRPERKNSVTVFLDEGGEFSARAVKALEEIVEHTNRAGSGFEVVIRQVGKKQKGAWSPLRGGEVARDVKRQLCMQENDWSPQDLLHFMTCRAKQDRDRWTECVAHEDEAQLESVVQCANGDQGTTLMNNSFEESAAAFVQQTPYVLVNNRYPIESYSPDSIATEVCLRNPGNTLCSFRPKSDLPKQAE